MRVDSCKSDMLAFFYTSWFCLNSALVCDEQTGLVSYCLTVVAEGGLEELQVRLLIDGRICVSIFAWTIQWEGPFLTSKTNMLLHFENELPFS